MDANTTHNNADLVQDGRFVGTYWQWLKNQLSGWDRTPWLLFSFITGAQLMNFALQPINWISVVSLLATLAGSLCTCAMAAGGVDPITGTRAVSRSINGLFGAISVVGFIIVNLSQRHFFAAFDQLVFFFLIDVELLFTWRTWGRGKNAEIKQLTKKGYAYTILAMLVAWGALYFVGIALKDQQPVFDSLVLAMGAVASWLCFRRYSFTYKIWLVSDIAQVSLFVATIVQAGMTGASLAMVLNYVFYFGTAVLGVVNWRPTDEVAKN